MPWTVIEFPIPESLGEAASEALQAAGAHTTAVEWREGGWRVRGFWHDTPELLAVVEAGHAVAALRDSGLLDVTPAFVLKTLEDGDWLEGWKQYFTPIVISPRLAIVPSWETFTPAPGQAVVILDPGMAFGTGAHGTTLGCLTALAQVLKPGDRVLDIGTGSGILAIAAVKLGASQVVATDNDPLAVRVARENAERNNVEIDFRVADLLTGVGGPYDIVLANILAPVIHALIPLIGPVLCPGGAFISSGYITSQEPAIAADLAAAGYTLTARQEINDWVTLTTM